MKFLLHGDDGSTSDVTEAVQIMYDTVGASLDFGSGFLDADEVLQMERLGRLAGFKPLEYPGEKCKGCGHDRDQHRAFDREPHCWEGSRWDGNDRLTPICRCTVFISKLGLIMEGEAR